MGAASTAGLGAITILFLVLAGIVGFVLFVAFVLVPLVGVLGATIAAIFRGIGWIIMHLSRFVAGMLGDSVRFVGALLASIVMVPLVLFSVLLGRWSAANHYAESVVREGRVAGGCLYRVGLRHPLRLLLLDGLLEGLEQRVPAAMAAAPTADMPSSRTGQFDGYRIVGSLRSGGSGAKLYVAEPEPRKRAQIPGLPDHVVIKSFAITDGSSLPQIIRESRALEAAKQLGLVLDHGMEEHRFHYVMPYHAGDHLGVVTRQLHGESPGDGLGPRQLRQAMGYINDLVVTLSAYHGAGLWHKDVKPDNLIVENGHVHLVDLGLVTPLRSAMTLTTHGTEYFRDPEMVRMALRGVKVHQVDGARFDIYAAGAVLYFMLENTFPAHGGLSAFSKRSPEALRWIVRRAMAEYSKRYESTEAMGMDLEYVLNAGDPYAIRPADLPSMRGVAPALRTPAAVASVATPAFPAGAADPGRDEVAGSRRHTPPPPPAAPGRATSGAAYERPRLRVTNWWTGAYVVEEAGMPQPPVHAVANVSNDPGLGAFPRRPAVDQLRSARARAQALRERARQNVHHHVRRGPHRTSAAVVALTMLFLLFVVGSVALLLFRDPLTVVRDPGAAHARTPDRGFPEPGMAVPGGWLGNPDDLAVEASVEGGRLVLVNTHVDPANPKVLEEIEKVTRRYRDRGYEVRMDDVGAIAALAPRMPRDPSVALDLEVLEPVLDEVGYEGIVWVTTGPGSGPAAERVRIQVNTLDRPSRVQRPTITVTTAPPAPPAAPSAPPALPVPSADRAPSSAGGEAPPLPPGAPQSTGRADDGSFRYFPATASRRFAA